MLAHKRPRLTRLSVEPLEERRLLSVASFQDGVSPTADYAGTRDVSLFGAEDSTNFGDATTLRADAEQGSTGEPVWSLVKWDLSGIPADSTINDVSITVNVTNTTAAPGFNLLAMRTDWVESEATWIGPTSTSTWEEPGVTDPSDFDPTVLGTMIGTATGPLTILLNSAGRAVVAGWLADPASNHGLLLSNPANSNSLRFDSREATTAANRPKLSIDFTFNDVDPPTAMLVEPLDNGPADQDDDEGEVRVGVRDSFVIQLDDFALDDATVTAETLTISKEAAPFTEFTFTFNAAADQITLTPTAGSFAEGSYTITLSGGEAKIADDSGNAMPSTVLTIVIDADLPTTPVAFPDAYQTAEDTPLIVDPDEGVLDNDFGGNAPGNAVLVSGPSSGTLALNPDGSFTYTPAANFTGQDSFTYTLETPLFTSNLATATIDVSAQSPVTSTDKYNGLEDELLTVDAASGVLANDSDPQGDDITAVLSRDVREGTLTLNPDGSFTYQPNENFVGPDSFRYRATDGQHGSAGTLVQITVENVNDPPVAVDDEYSISSDSQLRAGNLYEDVVLTTNPRSYWRFDESQSRDGDPVEDSSGNGFEATFRGSVTTVGGIGTAARFDGANDWIDLPSAPFGPYPTTGSTGNYNVSVELWFRADFGKDGVLLGQMPANTEPGGDISGGFTPALHIGANDGRLYAAVFWHDRGDRPITPQRVDDGQWHHVVSTYSAGVERLYVDAELVGTLQSPQLGYSPTYEYTLGVGFTAGTWAPVGNGTWHFLDGELDEVAIYDQALSPDVIREHHLVGRGAFVERKIGILTNDSDVDSDQLNVILVDSVENGTLEFAGDGSFTYTPDEDFTGIDTFTYVASDGQSTSNVATVTIRVGVAEVPADLTGNGFVDFEDLTVLLAAWNQNVSAAEGNLVDAGSSPVNFEDLTVLLAAWTGPGAAGAPVGRRLAAAQETSMSEEVGIEREVGREAPRRAAAYGRRANRSRPAGGIYGIGRLQAVAVDVVWAEEGAPRRARIRAAHKLRRQS